MSAILTHDTLINILILEVKGMTLSYHLPVNLNVIKSIKDCDDGFITMDTNYGEEYADFIELLEVTPFDKGFIRKCTRAIKGLRRQDIELRRT